MYKRQEQDAALPDGTKLLENGNILLPGETMIERNGNGTVILTPEGLRGQPGSGCVVISGDNQVSPIGTGTSGPDSNTQDNPAGPNESVSGNGYDLSLIHISAGSWDEYQRICKPLSV